MSNEPPEVIRSPFEQRCADVPGVWCQTFHVHSYEVDFNKNVRVENLCRYFQEAAWQHAEQLGAGYQRLHEGKLLWVLSRFLMKIERCPKWGEAVRVKTWPRQAPGVFAMRDFEMTDIAGELLAAGTSAWLVLDAMTRKPQRVKKVLSHVVSFPEKRLLEEDPKKLTPPTSRNLAMSVTVGYSDIDVNGHVNSSRYIGWLMDSYPLKFHQQYRVCRLEINFLAEALVAETLAIHRCQEATMEHCRSIEKVGTGDDVCRAVIIWRH